MSKVKSHVDLSPTLGLTEMPDGFWLYDKTRGANLAMRAKTSTEALVEALTYYQGRLKRVETELSSLRKNVDDFVSQFKENDDD